MVKIQIKFNEFVESKRANSKVGRQRTSSEKILEWNKRVRMARHIKSVAANGFFNMIPK